MAHILNGTEIAKAVLAHVARRVTTLKARGIVPHLVSIQVGSDAVSGVYVRNQEKKCRAAGIRYSRHHLDAQGGAEEIIAFVRALGNQLGVTGIIVQLPLPDGVDVRAVQSAIPPDKDVEGVSPRNIGEVVQARPHLPPCTAAAVLELLRAAEATLPGAEVVVVGHSEIVGKPIALMLIDQLATVTVCHVGTRELAEHTRRADVLISATGKPGLIGAEMVAEGACVIDVGMSQVTDRDGQTRLMGDVAFVEVAKKAGAITPVPGGVGPLTTAMLLANTVTAAEAAAESGRGD